MQIGSVAAEVFTRAGAGVWTVLFWLAAAAGGEAERASRGRGAERAVEAAAWLVLSGD